MSKVLSRLSPPPGARTREKRVGAGQGSGVGKTCGRGMKGQKARNPGNLGKPHFQGGQMPLQRRMPKRGFRVPFPIVTAEVNVAQLERLPAGPVGEKELRAARLVQDRGARIKILGVGEITKQLEVTAHLFSKTARAKIEKAGGKCIVVPFVRTRGPKSRKSAAAASS